MNILLYDAELIFNSEVESVVESIVKNKEKEINLMIAENENDYRKQVKECKDIKVVILSIRMFENEMLNDEIKMLRSEFPDSSIFIVGGRDLTDEILREAVKSGANNFITKPYETSSLGRFIEGALNE